VKTVIIKWLPLTVIAVLLFGWTLLAEETEKVNEYIGDSAKKCKMCHKDAVAAWEKWGKKKDDCISCHVTGFGEKGGWVSVEKTPNLLHVQCESCHGPAGDHMKAGMDKEKRAATMVAPTKETCLSCHNDKYPDFEGFDYEKSMAKIKHWADKEE
jgi:hypothetical protein